jgi:hypothetical protein
MTDRRRLAPFCVPLLAGILALANVLSNPRVATLHGSDVVQLIAVGLCFGVALTTLITFVRASRSSTDRSSGGTDDR